MAYCKDGKVIVPEETMSQLKTTMIFKEAQFEIIESMDPHGELHYAVTDKDNRYRISDHDGLLVRSVYYVCVRNYLQVI